MCGHALGHGKVYGRGGVSSGGGGGTVHPGEMGLLHYVGLIGGAEIGTHSWALTQIWRTINLSANL